MEQWARDRPVVGGPDIGRIHPIGAVSWLAQESELPRETIRRVIDGRSEYTEYRIAEPLIGRALERPELFYDGTLDIIDNPRISADSLAAARAREGSDANTGLTGSGAISD